MPVIKKGFLTKQGGASSTNILAKSFSSMSWKKRYFEFDGEKMAYYKSDTDREKLGEMDLSSGFTVAELTEKSKQEFSFEITTPGNIFLLSAESKKEMLEWIETLNQYSSSKVGGGGESEEEDAASLNVNMQEILPQCIHKGRLGKLGSKVSKFKQWRKRWFVLHPSNKLYYMKSLEDQRPLGVIDLATCSDAKAADEELNSQFTFVINVPGRAYYCQGENAQEVNMWLSIIGAILQALVERQMKLYMRTNSDHGTGSSAPSSPSVRPVSTASSLTSSTSVGDLGSPLAIESLELPEDMKKSEATLNAYLKILNTFGNDDFDNDESETEGFGDEDDEEEEDEEEEAAANSAGSAEQSSEASPAAQQMDDSTKNLINTLFRLNSMASKVMKHYSKLVGSEYLVQVLGPIIGELCTSNESMEVDPSKVSGGEDPEANKKKLVTLCQKIITAILGSKKSMPTEMAMMCKHLYLEVERLYPGNGPRQVGGYLFLRFFCPAIVQPNAHGVVRPDAPITDNSKRALLLITKVIQNLSNGILFGAKELYMGGPLNDFISTNIPILNKFFASFADIDLGGSPTPIPSPPSSEFKTAASLLTTNLRAAVQLDTEIGSKLGADLDDLNELLSSSTVEPDKLASLFGENCAIVSAACSTMKITQIDQLAEALVVMYCKSFQITKLLKWLITDEVSGTNLTAKLFDVTSTEGGVAKPVKTLKSGYLTKLGGNFKTWRKRWFVLTEDALSYYKSKTDVYPIQSIEMRVCSSIKYVDAVAEGAGFGFEISTPGRKYKFAADTDKERTQWIESIKPFVEKGLLANLMKARKQSAALPNRPSSMNNPSPVVDSSESAKLQPRTRRNVDIAMTLLAKEGYLVKKGGTFKSWQKRWFILKNGYLVYYKEETKSELLGLIDLEEVFRIESAEAKLNTPRCFEVCTSARTYHLVAETDALMKSWIDILRQVMYHFKPALGVSQSSNTAAKDPTRGSKPILEGWLTKQGGQNKSWKNRWFVLRENSLLYFENSADSTNDALAKGVIELNEAYVQTIEDHKFSFCFAVGTSNRVYFFLAKDRVEMDKWTKAIQGQSHGFSEVMDDAQSSKSREFLSKYHNAVLEKWNLMANQKPTVRVGAADLSQGATCGYLMKASKSLTDKSSNVKKWRYRYFVLRNHCLYYFKDTLDEQALGTIELANIEVEKVSDNLEACNMLLQMKGQKFWQRMGDNFAQSDYDYNEAVINKTGLVLKGRTKKFYLLTNSDQTTKMWVTAIKNATSEWEDLLEKAGVSEDQRKDANTAKFVKQFIMEAVNTKTTSIAELSKDSQLTSDLKKALTKHNSQALSKFQDDSSDDSSGDEGA